MYLDDLSNRSFDLVSSFLKQIPQFRGMALDDPAADRLGKSVSARIGKLDTTIVRQHHAYFGRTSLDCTPTAQAAGRH